MGLINKNLNKALDPKLLKEEFDFYIKEIINKKIMKDTRSQFSLYQFRSPKKKNSKLGINIYSSTMNTERSAASEIPDGKVDILFTFIDRSCVNSMSSSKLGTNEVIKEELELTEKDKLILNSHKFIPNETTDRELVKHTDILQKLSKNKK